MTEENPVVVVDPGGTGHPIEQVWVFVVVHDKDDEAIASAYGATRGAIPLVTGDADMVGKLMPLARRMNSVIKRTGKRIKVVRFTKVDEEEL